MSPHPYASYILLPVVMVFPLSRVSSSPLFIWLTFTNFQVLKTYNIILLCACTAPKTYQDSSGLDLCLGRKLHSLISSDLPILKF